MAINSPPPAFSAPQQPSPRRQPRRHLEGIGLRPMMPADIPAALAIEQASFDDPYGMAFFRAAIQTRHVIGRVVETSLCRVVGYMVYELHRGKFLLMNLAVAPQFRRAGVATHMIETLAAGLSHDTRRRIVAEVRETNIEAQIFFRASQFRASRIRRNHYETASGAEDAYVFQRWYQGYGVPQQELLPKNEQR